MPTAATSKPIVDPMLDEMAVLLSQHKLVPFFGAGLSRAHLGVAAAELAQEMAVKVGAPDDTLLSKVSDQFADKYGEDEFVSYLRSRLIVETLDEAKAPTHRLLISLMQNLVYTTNQDNIFELTAATYGRHYRRVVTIEDLSEAAPGEPLLVKFHGDTDVPSSLVFGERSYQARMAEEGHPLDIKLRADLLGKRLLFLGYSFSDENVAKLLDTVQRAFIGKLPPSYLIAFEYSDSMQELTDRYGIRIVDPRRLFPDAPSAGAAFERCLKMLCDCTLNHQAQRGVETMFSGGKVNPRTATDYEIEAVAKAIDTGPFETAIRAFRAEFDGALVATHQQQRVTDMFRKLTELATPTDDAQVSELRGAHFNFRAPPFYVAQATSYLMALCNRRPVVDGFDSLMSIASPALPKGSRPVAAALAVALIRERGEPVTENFRRLATYWFEGWEELDASLRETTKQMIDAAWLGSNSPFTPINRPSFLARKDFHDIMTDLQKNLPQRFKNPES